ncbi:hypothetical protein ACWCPS_25775 [Streptomyces mauvecolor]
MSRLLVLCAVLFGLFLMHGAPATAAEGCHGVMSAPTGMRDGLATTSSASASSAAAESAAAPVMTHTGVQRASGTAAMGGETCLSTPARDGIPRPMAALAAVITVMAGLFLAGRSPAAGPAGRRGPPPPGGRSLLLQVCIART